MLSRPCKVQRSPGEHQMALDTRKWGLKEGRTLAWVRATLTAGVKYRGYPAQSTSDLLPSSQSTLLSPAHTAHRVRAQCDSHPALLSTAVLSAGFQCPAGAGQASSCSAWNTAQCTHINTLNTASCFIKGTNLKLWNPILRSQIESFSKWLDESEVSKCLPFAPVYSMQVTTFDARRNSTLHDEKLASPHWPESRVQLFLVKRPINLNSRS